jgi:hypothetical protein
MGTYYFDWKLDRLDGYWNDDTELTRYGSVTELLESLEEPTHLVCEANFETYHVGRRAELIQRAIAAGHTWRVFTTRLTRRHGRELGHTNDEKSDELDAELIRSIAVNHPLWLKEPRPADKTGKDELEHIRAASTELNALRNTVLPGTPGPRGGKPKKYTAKDDWQKQLVSLLPPYESLTATQQLALGDGRGYGNSLIPAVAMAAKHATSRRDFEQLAGLFVNGHPSLIRSDIHHHSMRHRSGKMSRSDFRREVRWLYHRFREVLDSGASYDYAG